MSATASELATLRRHAAAVLARDDAQRALGAAEEVELETAHNVHRMHHLFPLTVEVGGRAVTFMPDSYARTRRNGWGVNLHRSIIGHVERESK